VISDGAPTGTVTTVLGNIDVRSLGRTNYHEHLFQITPLLPKPSWFATRPLSQHCLPVSESRSPRDAAQPASFR